MTARLLLMVSPALMAVASAVFGQASDASMKVEGAWARRAPMMQGGGAKAGSGNGAVYATLVNHGKQADALVAAQTDAAATAEIHESYRDMGMMMMRRIEKLDVPVGKKVEMKPGSYHIMLLNLKRDLKSGETVRVTLQFAKAGTIPVMAAVR